MDDLNKKKIIIIWAQYGSNMGPNGSNMGPNGSKWTQYGPKWSQYGPKWAQYGPKWARPPPWTLLINKVLVGAQLEFEVLLAFRRGAVR